MIKKTYIDSLDSKSVSVAVENYIIVDGEEQRTGEIWMRAYVNSERGRAQVETELTGEIKNIVLSAWGVLPTIFETEPMPNVTDAAPNAIEILQAETAQLQAVDVEIMGAIAEVYEMLLG